MNTRMFWTPGAAWFGGGADLNPCIEYPEDTAHFHGQMQAACDAHDPDYYARFKAWADTYFFIPHRGRARGVGGIFYDDLCHRRLGGRLCLYPIGRPRLLARLRAPDRKRRLPTPWTEADRETQLIHRGLYAEYNLVYDRGTKFGLESGHDPAAVLMSLPPGGQMDLNRFVRAEMPAFLQALQLLTRLRPPVEVDFSPEDSRASPRWYPGVGVVIGLITGVIYWGAALLFPPVVAVLVVDRRRADRDRGAA